jgi:metal-dependent hydrolase (beta-lactamase superfamily II)
MDVFDVGQANFVAIRHGNHVLVVDCGSSGRRTMADIRIRLQVENSCLRGVPPENFSFVITHDHSDHHSLLTSMLEWERSKRVVNESVRDEVVQRFGGFIDRLVSERGLDRDEFVGGSFFYACKRVVDALFVDDGGKNAITDAGKREIRGIFTNLCRAYGSSRTIADSEIEGGVSFLKGRVDDNPGINVERQVLFGFAEDLGSCIAFLRGCLGDDVLVVPVRPAEYPTFGRDNVHKQNLIVTVELGVVKILLPGDADCDLLTLLENAPEDNFNPGLFENVSIMLLPHHGSSDHGELLWFNYVVKKGELPLLVLASSDAAAGCLPSEFMPFLNFDGRRLGFCRKHDVLIHGARVVETEKPIFTTSNVFNRGKGGFYRITVDGCVKMFSENHEVYSSVES